MNYEKDDTWWTGKKRTQTNPNKPNLQKAQNERKLNSNPTFAGHLGFRENWHNFCA
jgi:hypothetical protein